MRTFALSLLILALANPALAQRKPPSGGSTPAEDDIELAPLTPTTPPAETETAAPPPPPPEPKRPQGPACEATVNRALGEGPVVIGFFASEQATGRRACPRTEVGLQLGGDAEIDIPRYRALMGGGATLYGSYALSPRLEVFGSLEAFRMTFAQGASLSVTEPGLGNLTGGATYVLWMNEENVFSATGRLLIPTNTVSINARTTVLEAGGIYSHRFGDAFEAHGFAGVDFAFALTPATPQPRVGLLLGAGVQWNAAKWFALAVDLQSHFGDRAGLLTEDGSEAPFIDYLAPALAARFAATDALGFEIALATHLLGHRSLSFSPGLRTESGVQLRAHYRF